MAVAPVRMPVQAAQPMHLAVAVAQMRAQVPMLAQIHTNTIHIGHSNPIPMTWITAYSSSEATRLVLAVRVSLLLEKCTRVDFVVAKMSVEETIIFARTINEIFFE